MRVTVHHIHIKRHLPVNNVPEFENSRVGCVLTIGGVLLELLAGYHLAADSGHCHYRGQRAWSRASRTVPELASNIAV